MKSTLKRLARLAGLEVFRYGVRRVATPMRVRDHSYAPVFPAASYSPWLDDTAFHAIYERVSANTLVDVFRCYELWTLACQVAHLPGDFLEVGVWRGGTGAILAAASARTSPTRTVFLADTFRGVVKAGEHDPGFRGGEHADTSSQLVRRLLLETGLVAQVLEGIFPDDFRDVAARRFSLVHVDVDTFDSARDIVDATWPRIPVGGIVVFDDYGFQNCSGIATLVDGYRGQSDRLVVHNLNGHAVMIKTS